MLSRTDETELLEPLHAGVHEAPPWGTFLGRLRQRTRAACALLIAGGEPLFAGEAPGPLLLRAELAAPGSPRLEALRPGRVYAAEELFDPASAGGRRRALAFGRVMRVAGAGAQGWLMVLREGRDFVAGDSAILARLAPHLAIALETHGRLDRARRACAMADEAAARGRVGWLALDAEARVTMASAEARRLLAGAGVSAPNERRLTGLAAPAEETLAIACTKGGRDGLPIRLVDRPPIDLLPLPAPAGEAMLLGLLRLAPARAPADTLAALYGLSASEARLVEALAGGASLDEAATRCGLTRETARTYSKRVFAKTGARGQADLVRLVLSGLAALA